MISCGPSTFVNTFRANSDTWRIPSIVAVRGIPIGDGKGYRFFKTGIPWETDADMNGMSPNTGLASFVTPENAWPPPTGPYPGGHCNDVSSARISCCTLSWIPMCRGRSAPMNLVIEKSGFAWAFSVAYAAMLFGGTMIANPIEWQMNAKSIESEDC